MISRFGCARREPAKSKLPAAKIAKVGWSLPATVVTCQPGSVGKMASPTIPIAARISARLIAALPETPQLRASKMRVTAKIAQAQNGIAKRLSPTHVQKRRRSERQAFGQEGRSQGWPPHQKVRVVLRRDHGQVNESQGTDPNEKAAQNQAPAHDKMQSLTTHTGQELSPKEGSKDRTDRGSDDCVANGDIGDD